MRFKEGSKVEVWRKKNETCGSWFPAKILSKAGKIYTVRYVRYLNSKGEGVVEKGNEEDIRPCPPSLQREGIWVLGDVAEVFDLRSWRVGRIVETLGSEYFDVLLFGSVRSKKFHISDLRVRQAWSNNRWIMLGKASKEEESYKNLNFLEGDNGKSKRKRTSELCEHYPPIKRALPTKVDAFPFHNDLVDKNSLQSLSKALPFTEENIECVASCSGNNSPVNSFQNTRKNSRGNSENFFDDTSSSSPKHKLATNIHELELHAYNSTVRALYASGPLSWEKESILTNLRMSLHISNEEHLLQLRNLLSA